ncbi:MAG TPA: peptidoglycan-binding protein, partial [Steroidobacteraceae bacterium]|nr:peptidoglycan-binding protein [Steroidobacteraceae bacterium]
EPELHIAPRRLLDSAHGASAAGTSAAGRTSGPGASASPSLALATLLAQQAARDTPESAFAQLFSLWGAHFQPGPGADPCAQAADQGLACYEQKGSLAQLRLYNRPAILLLEDDAGAPHLVVLRGLDDERARVQVGGRTQFVSIAELSRYWFGDFTLLWQPQMRDVRALHPGMRGAEVLQLRQDLQRLAGGAAAGAPAGGDLYDGTLSQMVRDFQRRHRLSVDGVAGVQTLVVLNSATAKPDSPLLSAAHGS